MKLFIDTSNKKIIFALINNKNRIVDFKSKDSNNNMVKETNVLLDNFLKTNNLLLKDINEYMITIGPGSFTGVKIAYNIVGSMSLVKNIKKIYVIDSFKLISNIKFKNTVIPFGKSKFYCKSNWKIKVIEKEDLKKMKSVYFGYDDFSQEILQEKIDNNLFKLVDNLNKVKIKYLSTF